MSDESKQSPADGRSASPTGAAGGDAIDQVLAGVARGVGQRGPGKRRMQFVAQVAAQYGVLSGDLLVATLMRGLPEYLAKGGELGAFLEEERAVTLAKALKCDVQEAFGALLAVGKELNPYLHQRQPIASDGEQRSIVFAAVTSDGQVAGPGQGRRDLRPADVRKNPMETVIDHVRSDAGGRTDAPSALNAQEE